MCRGRTPVTGATSPAGAAWPLASSVRCASQRRQPYTCSTANAPCSSMSEYSFASKKIQPYSATDASPTGQHSIRRFAVSQIASALTITPAISREDIVWAPG